MLLNEILQWICILFLVIPKIVRVVKEYRNAKDEEY